MSVNSHITDGRGGKSKACVSNAGQLITAPFAYDETKFLELDVINTAYNFYGPVAGQQFVITGLRAKADRGVSTNADATVIIYEASSDTTTTVDKILHQEAMVSGESVTMRMNIIVNEGKYVNAKTDDDDIHMTIMGYYVPALK
jgi:hypothetical protein